MNRFFAILLLWCSLEGAAQAMPPLVLPDLSGEAQTLETWRGRVLLLNFWAPWCVPCQAEIRHLIRWQEQYGKQGLQVIGVGLDDPRSLGNAVRTLGIPYPVLVADPEDQKRLLARWGSPNGFIPYTVVIGADGEIEHRYRGILDESIFSALVLPLLQPASP